MKKDEFKRIRNVKLLDWEKKEILEKVTKAIKEKRVETKFKSFLRKIGFLL